MKIAIVEDRTDDLNTLRERLNKYAKEKKLTFQITTYYDSLMLLADYSMQYDCIFMDILAPGVNGMDGTKSLRKIDPSIPVIFVTSLEQYAVQGYSVNAFDYILKPIDEARFNWMMDRLCQTINKETEKELFVKCTGVMTRIPIKNLYYISVEGHNVSYHTNFGVFQTRDSMKSVEESLSAYNFVRVSASYLVNLDHIANIQGNEIVVGWERLAVSRSKKKKLLEVVNEYLSSKI